MGATRALPTTKATCHAPLSRRARRNATAQNASCDAIPENVQLGILRLKWEVATGQCDVCQLAQPGVPLKKRLHHVVRRALSHVCPILCQMLFSSKRATMVTGATRPMGSNTEDTRLRTSRYVSTGNCAGKLVPRLHDQRIRLVIPLHAKNVRSVIREHCRRALRNGRGRIATLSVELSSQLRNVAEPFLSS